VRRLADVSHWVQEEVPEAVNEIIEAFLATTARHKMGTFPR
jgi:pimeloyl-ACP methyl ester carboxylesterase